MPKRTAFIFQDFMESKLLWSIPLKCLFLFLFMWFRPRKVSFFPVESIKSIPSVFINTGFLLLSFFSSEQERNPKIKKSNKNRVVFIECWLRFVKDKDFNKTKLNK